MSVLILTKVALVVGVVKVMEVRLGARAKVI
jgi:hypothetical protein